MADADADPDADSNPTTGRERSDEQAMGNSSGDRTGDRRVSLDLGERPRWGDVPRLLVGAVGSFHAALLMVSLVLALHVANGAGELADLGTGLGAVLYLYLWVVLTWTTGRGLRMAGVRASGAVESVRRTFLAGALWGGIAGVVFLAGILVPLVSTFILSGANLLAVLAIFGGIGGVVSFVVGTMIGLVFVTIDLGALWAARRLIDEQGRGLESRDANV